MAYSLDDVALADATLADEVDAALARSDVETIATQAEGWVSFPVPAELVDDTMRFLHRELDLEATEKATE